MSDKVCDEACVLNSVTSIALNAYDCAVVTTPISSHTSNARTNFAAHIFTWGVQHGSYIIPHKVNHVFDVSYTTVVVYSRDDQKVGFYLPQNITQKPASNFIPKKLAALVRFRLAQKCLQINSKHFVRHVQSKGS